MMKENYLQCQLTTNIIFSLDCLTLDMQKNSSKLSVRLDLSNDMWLADCT